MVAGGGCAVAGLDTEIEMLEISGGTLSDTRRLFGFATDAYFLRNGNTTNDSHRAMSRQLALSTELTFSV